MMKTQLKFTKMQGAGNDFVVLNGFEMPISLTPAQIKHIANRNFGVGCDQVLIVEKTTLPNVDFKYRIFNADGGEVAQCGNGARCFVRYVLDKGLTKKTKIYVETASGLITLTLQHNNQVCVNMGAPRFLPAQIPLDVPAQQGTYLLNLGGLHGVESQQIAVSALSMGNPHAVVLVDDVDDYPVADIGAQIEWHTSFPQRVNAGFMQVINPHEIKLRVYERGSGETLACGTGACAAAVSGIQLGLLKSPVLVHARGGDLSIEWAGESMPVMMTGGAEMVFEGEIAI